MLLVLLGSSVGRSLGGKSPMHKREMYLNWAQEETWVFGAFKCVLDEEHSSCWPKCLTENDFFCFGVP